MTTALSHSLAAQGIETSATIHPNLTSEELTAAALENGEAAVATASGMAAVSAAVMAAVEGGDHIVATTGLYSGTYHLLTEDMPSYGVETTLVEATDPAAQTNP